MSASYIQWYNENEGRAYPLREDCTLLSDDNKSLPSDIIVDLGLLVPYDHSDLYFSSIRVTPNIVSVGISSASSGIFVGTYARSTIQPYVAYTLTSLVNDVTGWIAFGNHIISSTEDYRFSAIKQSGIIQHAVRVVATLPVKKFLRLNGDINNNAEDLVSLAGGQGVIIKQDEDDSQNIIIKLDNTLKHAFVGPCNEAARKDSCGVTPMRSINGVCPDANGKITLRFE